MGRKRLEEAHLKKVKFVSRSVSWCQVAIPGGSTLSGRSLATEVPVYELIFAQKPFLVFFTTHIAIDLAGLLLP